MRSLFISRRLRRCVLLIICVTVLQVVWIFAGRFHPSIVSGKSKLNVTRVRSDSSAEHKKSSGVTPVTGPPILLWWDSVYTNVDEIKSCGKHKCRIANNRSLQGDPDTKVFIFYGSHFRPYALPFPRKPDHLWALIHEESPRNAYILSHGNTLSMFNMTSSYNRWSHYPITTQWLQCPEWIQDTSYVLPLVDKNRLRKAGLAPILYLHSDCGVPSDRDNFVKLLQKYIPVDSYGSCVRNKEMPERLRFRNNMAPLDDKAFFRFAARYKFTLSIENYVCDDYLTEKLWRPLRLGSVPIVFGAPNIRDYLPSNTSAIIIEDFQDVEDLAQYIHLLDSHDKLYKTYLKFKNEPIENPNLQKILDERDWEPDFCSRPNSKQHAKSIPKRKPSSLFFGFECYICKAVSELMHNESHIGNKQLRYAASSPQYGCPSPRQFDKKGRYSVHSNRWSAEWNYGKYEAVVLEGLYQDSKTVSQQEFHRLVKQAMKEDMAQSVDAY